MSGSLNPPGQTARYLVVAVGGLLAAAGLRRGSWAGAVLALVGGGLVCSGLRSKRAVRGSGFDCAAHLARYGAGVTAGIYDHAAQAAKEERHPAGTFIEDVVEEASDDSFPCSDPPAWTARS